MSLPRHTDLSLPLVPWSFDCPVCFGTLAFHQPDTAVPRRLLATCSECRSWFLATDGVMGLLPDEDDLLDKVLRPDAWEGIHPSRN